MLPAGTSIDCPYDATGNRLTQVVEGLTTSYSYNALDQLLSAGTETFTYDGRGNLVTASDGVGTTTYAWDARDRLSGVALPDGTSIGYSYDHAGRRVGQTIDGTVTNYLWDERSLYGDVVLETDGAGDPLASYTLGGSELVSQTRAGTLSYYLMDALGSVRALTDASAAVTDTYDFNAFGELYASTGSTENSYLFAGQRYDALVGQYYMRARYYAPAIGRFLARDPLQEAVGHQLDTNRYYMLGIAQLIAMILLVCIHLDPILELILLH